LVCITKHSSPVCFENRSLAFSASLEKEGDERVIPIIS